MGETIYQEIRDNISITDFARANGLQPNRMGMCLCPFHNEKNASLKLYESAGRFNCFGCNAYGDVVDLACGLWNCSIGEALKRLDREYNLGVLDRNYKPVLKPKSFEFDLKAWRSKALDSVAFHCRQLASIVECYDEMLHVGYEPIQKNEFLGFRIELELLESFHQELLVGEPLELFKKYGKEIQKYERARKESELLFREFIQS